MMCEKKKSPQFTPRKKHNHPRRVPDEKRAQIVVEAACTSMSQRQIAKKHGIKQQTVSNIVNENPEFLQELLAQQNAKIADLTYDRIIQAFEAFTDEKLEDAKARDLAVTIGILDDHYRTATSQPTAHVRHSLADVDRELAACIRDARAHGISIEDLLEGVEDAEVIPPELLEEPKENADEGRETA